MRRGFRITHAVLPGTVFLAGAWAGAFTGMDTWLARRWAFDAVTGRFIGTGPGAWWAEQLIHGLGGAGIRIAGLLLLLCWIFVRRNHAWLCWQRPLDYAVSAVAICVILTGLLKATSNVDCPRVLEPFGGVRPYVHFFADRPDGLPRAHCFPGGHSASGFALFALYFMLRDRWQRLAQSVLVLAVATGTLFAIGQEARGAHFLSHDLWSAAIAWFTCLTLYSQAFHGQLWPSRDGDRGLERTHADRGGQAGTSA